MRIAKMVLVMTLLAAVVVSGAGCIFKSTESTTSKASDVATVQRGNMQIDITASGNLALSDKQELAFEIGGTIGGTGGTQLTVEEVLVEDGDMVKKGQVLARLDDSTWQDYLDTLRNSVTTAQRNQTTKERALISAQRQVDTKDSALAAAQRQVTSKELALRQAQLSLQTAEYNLNQIAEVKKAQNVVDIAEAKVKLAQAALEMALESRVASVQATYTVPTTPVDLDSLMVGVIEAQKTLAAAKAERQQVLTNTGVRLTYDVATDVATKVLAVDQAKRGVDNAQVDINDAKTAVVTAQNALDDAKLTVEDAETAVDDIKKSVADAQKKLDEALAKSTEIVAPFDGFITVVNATGGQAVNKGFVACVIADPNKFESTIMVDETDISKVKIDGAATVQVDSVGMSFPAKVTRIAPTATIQSGVVKFRVKVELESLTPIQSSQQGAYPGQARQGVSSGQTPGQTRQGASAQQAPAASSQKVQLWEGLTATVNILVAKRDNVILVPSRAITRQGGSTTVQVVKGNSTEQRTIRTGISDYVNTEVLEGLSEGEQVVIIKTATTSTTSTTQRQQQQMFMPGMPPPQPVRK